ncbi:MAG: signal peptidase II [Bacillota bacterium]|nr:signal peptidase II [Bacillota bacterium]
MIYAIVAVLVLIADQWLKYWVTANVTLETGSQPIIDGVVKLVNTHNSGAAFGLLDNVPFARWILLGLAVAMCIVVIILIAKRTFPGKFPTWCMVLFMAGALGNCIDRSIYGYVVDMFKLEFVSFAVFNVADIFLTVSCLLFIIYLFVGGKDEEELEAEIRKSKKSKKQDKDDSASAEAESSSEEDVWNSFKAALHTDSEDEEELPPEPKRKARKSALTVAKEEPSPEIKIEAVPEVKEEPMPVDNADELPAAACEPAAEKAEEAAAPAVEEFSLEDILREFGG